MAAAPTAPAAGTPIILTGTLQINGIAVPFTATATISAGITGTIHFTADSAATSDSAATTDAPA
jgi:hypothetical protein